MKPLGYGCRAIAAAEERKPAASLGVMQTSSSASRKSTKSLGIRRASWATYRPAPTKLGLLTRMLEQAFATAWKS
jgi:hypothetical protein